MDNSNSTHQPSTRVALVTGATGFIGGSLISRLTRENWRVHIIFRKNSELPKTPEILATTGHAYDGTTEGMIDLVKSVKPDVVFHLASLFLSQHQTKDLEPLILSNIMLGSQLLEAMRVNGVRRIVNTGTSWQHFDNADYNPVCLYAATKQAFEDILTYYTEDASIQAITLQLFDTYGPKDPRPKLFYLLGKASGTQEVLAMSPGEQLIDLVYIDDVIDAYLCAADRFDISSEKHQVFAVSSGKPITLKKLVQEYEEINCQELPIAWGARSYRQREVMVPWNRGRPLDGWAPKISLPEGIRRTLNQP